MGYNKSANTAQTHTLCATLRVCIPASLLSTDVSSVVSKSDSIMIEYPMEPSKLGDGVNVTSSVTSTPGKGVSIDLTATQCPSGYNRLIHSDLTLDELSQIPYDCRERMYADQVEGSEGGLSDDLPF